MIIGDVQLITMFQMPCLIATAAIFIKVNVRRPIIKPTIWGWFIKMHLIYGHVL